MKKPIFLSLEAFVPEMLLLLLDEMNTPELKCPLDRVFRQALLTYEAQKIKFADAVMGYWGLEEGLSTVYTYDESDFKKISGLQVRRP